MIVKHEEGCPDEEKYEICACVKEHVARLVAKIENLSQVIREAKIKPTKEMVH